MTRNLLILLVAAGWLAGCSSTPRSKQEPLPPQIEVKQRGGGYYLDDGPEASPPPNLHAVPDAVPRDEPLHRFANRSYEVKGVSYKPMMERAPFRQTGLASWYGKRFHGKKTATGETYDMYGMTAAHPTLPIPSYVKVTSLDTGKSVIVRVNDRGPFHSGRVIDLSYTAAYKLGLLQKGSGRVSVESVGPEIGAVTPLAAIEPIKTAPLAPETELAPRNEPRQAAAPAAGIYVQLGAFGNLENARKLLARAREALSIPAEQLQIALIGSLHRVNLGPFADRHEASGWVEKSNAALGIAAITVTR